MELVPRHVEAAPAAIGDVRALSEPDDTFDVVRLLGPLNHAPISPAGDAFAEASRVAGPGGLVAAAAITRYASLRARHVRPPSYRTGS